MFADEVFSAGFYESNRMWQRTHVSCNFWMFNGLAPTEITFESSFRTKISQAHKVFMFYYRRKQFSLRNFPLWDFPSIFIPTTIFRSLEKPALEGKHVENFCLRSQGSRNMFSQKHKIRFRIVVEQLRRIVGCLCPWKIKKTNKVTEFRRTEFNRFQLDRITKFSFASLPVFKSDLKLATVKQRIVHLYIVQLNVHRKK